MCIIVYKPKDTALNLDWYKNCFNSNPDGAGLVAHVPGVGLHLRKGFMAWGSFEDEVVRHSGREVLMHFRIKTHGAVNAANCHPFDVGGIHGNPQRSGRLVMVHNGILDIACPQPGMSDTWHFVRDRLYPIWKRDNRFIERTHMISLLGDAIGTDKMAFMSRNGNVTILNCERGHWDGGHWFSNTSYKWSVSYGYDDYIACGDIASRFGPSVMASGTTLCPPFDIADDEIRDRYSEYASLLAWEGVTNQAIEEAYQINGIKGLEDLLMLANDRALAQFTNDHESKLGHLESANGSNREETNGVGI